MRWKAIRARLHNGCLMVLSHHIRVHARRHSYLGIHIVHIIPTIFLEIDHSCLKVKLLFWSSSPSLFLFLATIANSFTKLIAFFRIIVSSTLLFLCEKRGRYLDLDWFSLDFLLCWCLVAYATFVTTVETITSVDQLLPWWDWRAIRLFHAQGLMTLVARENVHAWAVLRERHLNRLLL